MTYNLKKDYTSMKKRAHSQFNYTKDWSIKPTIDINTDFSNKSLLSDKVPIHFTPRGIDFKQIPLHSLREESKVELYSEIERLTVLNFELKKQNDTLMREIERQNFLIMRIPDFEYQINELQRDLLRKDGALNSSMADIDHLFNDNQNLSKFQKAHDELVQHNSALVIEIDKLNAQIKSKDTEVLDLLQKQAIMKELEARIQNSNQNIEMLSIEIIEKNREIFSYQARIEDLKRVHDSEIENLRIQIANLTGNSENQSLFVKQKEDEIRELISSIENIKIIHHEELKKILEDERSASVSKSMIDQARFESEILLLKKQLQEANNKLGLLAVEYETLMKINLDKDSRIDALNLRMINSEHNFEKTKIDIENTKRVEMGQQASEIIVLKKTISDLQQHISTLRLEHEANEKSWSLRIKEAIENENRNWLVKSQTEKNSYEVQLMSHKQRNFELEKQLELMTNETERLTQINLNLSQNQESLRIDLETLKISSKSALEEQKIKLEIDKRKAVESAQIDLLRSHETQMDIWKQKNLELELKQSNLISEVNKLSNELEERLKEIELLKVRYQSNEDKHSQTIQDLEKMHETKLKMTLERELNILNQKSNIEISNYETRFKDSERTCQLLTSEIERLNFAVIKKEEEISEEKKKYSSLENQRAQDIAGLRHQFEVYKQANLDVSTLQIRFEAEKSSLNSLISQQKEKNQELEKRIELLINENDKIGSIYLDKNIEMENLRRKLSDIEEEHNQRKLEMEMEIDRLKRVSHDYQELSLRYNSEKHQYENQIRQLKALNDNGKQDLEKVYELMNQRKREFDVYIKQNDELKKQVERLSSQLRSLDNDSSAKKDRVEGLTRTLDDVEQERDLYKNQVERLNFRLTETQDQLNKKIKELDILRQQYEKSMEITGALNNELLNKLMKSDS